MILLIYPSVYILLTLPLAIERLLAFENKTWGYKGTYVGAGLFDSLGFVNAILYTSTRKGIIDWSWFGSLFRSCRRPTRRGSASTLEIVGSRGSCQPKSTVTYKPSAISIASLDPRGHTKSKASADGADSDLDWKMDVSAVDDTVYNAALATERPQDENV